MSFIIVPKNTQKVISVFTEAFDLKKIPKSEGKFWHGNFNDYLYDGLGGKVKVLFSGYSGAVVGQALFEYYSNYLPEDPNPEVYFVGSVYAFRDSDLEPGDLVYASDTFSPDSFEQSIYKNAEGRNLKNYTQPEAKLLEKFLAAAKTLNNNFKLSKVYCCITPGYRPEFNKPKELMNEAMWWKLSLSKINDGDYDSGEYESASVLATCRLLAIPAIAIFDVKDKRYSATKYKIATDEQKKSALNSILNTIKKSIIVSNAVW